jgi:hypothetical protein
MQIRPVGAELFLANGRTDGQTNKQTHTHTNKQTNMTKLIVAFRNFENAYKKILP